MTLLDSNSPHASHTSTPSATASIPDVQARQDLRRIAIDQVGIRGLRYPLLFQDGKQLPLLVAAQLELSVALSAQTKGTHMSRFVELLEAQDSPLTIAGLEGFVDDMLRRLDASQGRIAIRFPWFLEKAAPVTGIRSRLDYEIGLEAWRNETGNGSALSVQVPVTSLCPCSKEISRYGAHNQRSAIAVRAVLASPIGIGDLIHTVETQGSSELYGLLKRADEKHVTERAYENPKFVEDLVRDVALALREEARIASFSVDVENFESIHNHSAWARIEAKAAQP